MSDDTKNKGEGTKETKPYDLFGEEFGRYHVGKELGQGGYARVYRATEPEIEREVALKILLPGDEGTYSEKLRKRFLREAKLVARLKDHHTIKLFDYGEENGLLYLAFEYVEGETLGQKLKREGPLKPFALTKLLEQLLDSLKEAHDLGILHRDIKPGNIMLYEHERRGVEVKVLDFGIGKFVREQKKHTQLTAEGRMIGTPRYMSPEQMRGAQDLGPGCDLWAVGMVAYECLVGRPAIETDDAMAMTTQILDDTPFEVPDEVEVPVFMREMVAKLLRKDPSRRYQNANQVLEDLEEFRTRATIELQGGVVKEKLDKLEEEAKASELEESNEEDATPGERPSARKVEQAKQEASPKEKSEGVENSFAKKVALAAVGLLVCVGVALAVFSGDTPNEEVPAFLLEQEPGAAAVELETDETEQAPAVLEQGEETATKAKVEPASEETKEVEKAPAERSKDRPVERVEVEEAAEAVEKKPVVAEATKKKPEEKSSEQEEPKKEVKKKAAVAEATATKEEATSPATKQETEEASKVEEEKEPEKTKLRIWGVE